MSSWIVRMSWSRRNAMYSVMAALKRLSYSAADAIGACGGSFALRCSSIARRAWERASSRSMIVTSSCQVYGTSWTFFRYQS